MEEPRMFLSIVLTLFSIVVSEPVPGELRAPRVYNALITSGENLTPSRALPVFQPILHETAYGYPLQQTLIYHDALKENQQLAGNQPNRFVVITNAGSKNPFTGKIEQQPDQDSPESKTKTNEPNKNQQPSDPSAPENPLKLNEFGLPPSLIPIQQYEQRNPYPYDPYNPYNTFHPSLYNNPYNQPYPYNPYLYQNLYYNIPPMQTHPGPTGPLAPPGSLSLNGLPSNGLPPNGLPPNGLPPNGLTPNDLSPNNSPPNAFIPNGFPTNSLPSNGLPPNGLPPNSLTPARLPPNSLPPAGPHNSLGQPVASSPPEPQLSEPESLESPDQQRNKDSPSIPNSPPQDLNIKNNGNKNPEIPDVPPPPLPRGGLKYDNDKSQSS